MQGEAAPRPWIAGALTVLLPGLGHLYAGDVSAAVRWHVLFTLSGTAAILTMLLPFPYVNLVLPLLVALTTYVVVVRSALRFARERSRSQAQRRRIQRWYFLLAVTVGYIFLVQPIVLSLVRRVVATSLVSTSEAMAPTVIAGDHFLLSPYPRFRSGRRKEPWSSSRGRTKVKPASLCESSASLATL